MTESAPTVPLYEGQPITPGWWWLQFSDGPGPRHWDGTFWDRGSYFATAEDYADNPVLGPCSLPQSISDSDRVNWLVEHQAWLIELDDGRSIDASRGDLRGSIDAAMAQWPEVPVDDEASST